MPDNWERTAIQRSWIDTSYRAPDGYGWRRAMITWRREDWIFATIRLNHHDSSWKWEIWEAGSDRTIAKGESASESKARAAVMRRVKPLLAQREKKYLAGVAVYRRPE